MLQIYNKNPIYKHKYRKKSQIKKGVTYWVTPFYFWMIIFGGYLYFTSSKSASVTLSSLPPLPPLFWPGLPPWKPPALFEEGDFK